MKAAAESKAPVENQARVESQALVENHHAPVESESRAQIGSASRAKWLYVVAAIALLLTAGGYFMQRTLASRHSEASMPGVAAETVAEGVKAPAKPDNAGAPAPASLSPAPSAAPSPVAEVPVFPTSATARPASIDPPKPQKARTRAPAPVAAALEPEPPPVVAPAPAPPPPPIVREAPRPDPWQPLNDALARCPRNDILGRGLCEQRALMQFCNGHWGQVPQCASLPYIDHGQ